MIWLYLFLFFGVFKMLLFFFFFFTVNGVALESRNWWGSDILTCILSQWRSKTEEPTNRGTKWCSPFRPIEPQWEEAQSST